jgi:hypothetical protein
MKQQERLERLAFVSRVEAGDEAAVREIAEADFPRVEFQRAGLVGYTLYMGGGYCVFEFGFEGQFEPIFERLWREPAAVRYFDKLKRYVDPAPSVQPGATAGQPIAADVFLWRIGHEPISRQPR